MSVSLPLVVTTLVVAMKVSMDGIKFKPAPHDSTLDDYKRKSQICNTPIPLLDKTSQPIINDYLSLYQPDLEYAKASLSWRILRYNETGHFFQHTDRLRPVRGYKHIATEIYLPPFREVQFEGGELVVTHSGKVQSIKPHATKWTHIILPLGMLHKVNQVTNGSRISYAKSVYTKKKDQSSKTQTKVKENSGQL